MDQIAAHSFSSVMFCVSTASMKTRVHFFPSAGTSTSHHGITCVLSLFGKGIERRSVVLDGGRLNQPDGVRLEDAFPSLRSEASGIFGLEMRLSCSQGRLSLLGSQAAIEFVSPQGALLYRAAPFVQVREDGTIDGSVSAPAECLASPSVAIGIQDSSLATSLVMINATDDLVRPTVSHGVGETAVPLQVGTVAPHSAMEIPLEESLFKGATPKECLWGLSRVEKISLAPGARGVDTGYYLMYRDPVSKRPLSVCAL